MGRILRGPQVGERSKPTNGARRMGLQDHPSQAVAPNQMPRCYLFDLDGTLADCTHRLHHIKTSRKNWNAFFAACTKDGPIPHMVELARHLSKVEKVVFCSGRSDQVRGETEQWLKDHGLSGPLY